MNDKVLEVTIPLKSESDTQKAVALLRQAGYTGEIRGRNGTIEKISESGSETISTFQLLIYIKDEAAVSGFVKVLARAGVSGMNRGMQLSWRELWQIS